MSDSLYVKRVWTDVDEDGQVIRHGSYKVQYESLNKVPHYKWIRTPNFSKHSYYRIYCHLVPMVSYQTNILRVKGRNAKVNDFIRKSGVCESTVKKFLSECRKNKIILRDESERAYIINPDYVMRGRFVHDWVYKMFL